jgi:hypothetical protein
VGAALAAATKQIPGHPKYQSAASPFFIKRGVGGGGMGLGRTFLVLHASCPKFENKFEFGFLRAKN